MMITACFCADSNYKNLLETAFYSFSRENKGSRVYILKYDDFDDNILKLIAVEHSIILTIHLLYDEVLPSIGRFSKAMYGRFHLYNIIQEKRFLYLDCDVIVNGSLKELFSLEFSENNIAMVKDIDSVITDSLKKKFNIENYYNSGVILFNKSDVVSEKIKSVILFLKENAENLVYPDQDAINFIFSGCIYSLDVSYNYMYSDKYNQEPKIVHYAQFKPWSFGKKSAYTYLYDNIVNCNPYDIKPFQVEYTIYSIIMTKLKCKLMNFGFFKFLQKVYWNYGK
ncbi:hypothetical protein RB975_002418 [Vibrio cholerae]|nr:hypothetical protein [Vibrio cholerae]ELG7083320.1 hypothetical protein [Vibrio cholerae]